jgi:hypothetical protein
MKITKNANKILVTLVFLFFSIVNSFGQGDEEEVTWRDRLFFGGNLGLVVGDITIIEVTPLAGYRITPRWSAGIGLKYEYYKSSGRAYATSTGESYSTSIYGGNIFTDFVFLKNFPTNGLSLFGHGEYEGLSLENKYFTDNLNSSGRYILNSVLIGIGLRQRMGMRSSLNIMLLWNLNETQNSPYPSNPILKFNFIL